MSAIRTVVKKLAVHFAALRARSEFSCADCERSERCGLAPSDTCIVRAAQLERFDRRLPRRYLSYPRY
jgi:hypothetical protein